MQLDIATLVNQLLESERSAMLLDALSELRCHTTEQLVNDIGNELGRTIGRLHNELTSIRILLDASSNCTSERQLTAYNVLKDHAEKLTLDKEMLIKLSYNWHRKFPSPITFAMSIGEAKRILRGE